MTILIRAFGDSQLRSVKKKLTSSLRGLKAQISVLGISPRGWVRVSISGEDESVASRLLAEEIGVCPESPQDLANLSVAKGYIANVTEDEIQTDIGILSSDTPVAIPLHELQAQLADGKEAPLRTIADLFALGPEVPLEVRISNTRPTIKASGISATLSFRQVSLLKHWTRSLLDRLLVLGASYGKVRRTHKEVRCSKYVLRTEQLGLFEHAIVFKLGIRAARWTKQVDQELEDAILRVFDPKAIIKLVGSSWPC